MTDLEQRARTRLSAHTADVTGGPDLQHVLDAGRRRRRRRGLGVAAAGVVTAAVLGTAAVVSLTTGDVAPDRAADPASDRTGGTSAPAAAPADEPTDFVPGTRVDERLAALVAEHLPELPAPDDVYPSDAGTAGPLPDDAFARATEWQAVYTPAPGHRVLVLMGFPVAGEDPARQCDGVRGPQCRVEERPDGGLDLFQRYTTDDDVTFFYSQVDPDGFRVSLLDTSPRPERNLQDVLRAHGLVADPRFTFEQGS